MGEPRPIEEDISQDRQAALLTRTGNAPTVDNEEQLLADKYGPADKFGVYGAPDRPDDENDAADGEASAEAGPDGDLPRQLGQNTGGLEQMIRAMEGWLGTGEPNAIQDWYRGRNGNSYAGNFAWCDATITLSAYASDNYGAACFDKDWAYTVAHAAAFNTAGQWKPMTNGILKSGIRRGDIIFFDWNGTSEIGAIDHVGIVTAVSGDGKYVYTIEGNTANVCARRVRVVHDIAGYGRPKYPTPAPVTAATPARYQTTINGLTYGYGAKGAHITAVGKALVKAGFGTHYTDGPDAQWTDADTRNYSDFQKSLGYKGTAAGQDADGVPGAGTLKKLMGSLPSKTPTAPKYEPFPGAGFFHGGRHSPLITAMGHRLVAEGCGKYNHGPGPDWTRADQRSYAAWQHKFSKANDLGWSDAECDGVPGKKSWDALRVPNV